MIIWNGGIRLYIIYQSWIIKYSGNLNMCFMAKLVIKIVMYILVYAMGYSALHNIVIHLLYIIDGKSPDALIK